MCVFLVSTAVQLNAREGHHEWLHIIHPATLPHARFLTEHVGPTVFWSSHARRMVAALETNGPLRKVQSYH